MGNPLLREPLLPEHVKPRLVIGVRSGLGPCLIGASRLPSGPGRSPTEEEPAAQMVLHGAARDRQGLRHSGRRRAGPSELPDPQRCQFRPACLERARPNWRNERLCCVSSVKDASPQPLTSVPRAKASKARIGLAGETASANRLPTPVNCDGHLLCGATADGATRDLVVLDGSHGTSGCRGRRLLAVADAGGVAQRGRRQPPGIHESAGGLASMRDRSQCGPTGPQWHELWSR